MEIVEQLPKAMKSATVERTLSSTSTIYLANRFTRLNFYARATRDSFEFFDFVIARKSANFSSPEATPSSFLGHYRGRDRKRDVVP